MIGKWTAVRSIDADITDSLLGLIVSGAEENLPHVSGDKHPSIRRRGQVYFRRARSHPFRARAYRDRPMPKCTPLSGQGERAAQRHDDLPLPVSTVRPQPSGPHRL